jgi:mono/diheme cytochrome c family protein
LFARQQQEMPGMSPAIRLKWLAARAAFVCVAAATAAGVNAQPAPAPGADPPPPPFPPAFMRDANAIALGKQAWEQQCRHCHGNSAYPGKAPKLSPGSMEPDFIYDRITYGFKGMPPWRAVFSQEQRMGLVAYIKSDSFSP